MTLEEKVLQIIPDSQEFISGFADMAGLLHPKFQAFSHAVVIGKKLDDKIVDAIKSGPTAEYYAHYQDVNRQLASLINELKNMFDSLGIKNIAMIANRAKAGSYYTEDYPKTLRMLFSHKMAAARAGLGWIGKTDLLVSEKFGPRLRLASIIVDRPLKCALKPVTESKCGNCTACVKACPVQAASGKSWRVGVDRDEFYDAFKCEKKSNEFARKIVNQDDHMCGICMAACPLGKKEKVQ